MSNKYIKKLDWTVYVEPKIFDFIEHWTESNKLEATYGIQIELKKYINSLYFEDIVADAILSVLEAYSKQGSKLQSSHLKYIVQNYLSLKYGKKMPMYRKMQSLVLDPDLFNLKEIGQDNCSNEENEFFEDFCLELEKRLSKNEFDVFQKIIFDEFSERSLCRSGFVSILEIRKLKKKIKKIMREYYEI